MLTSWFKRRDKSVVEGLYGAIVTRSRDPVFYRDLDVPDTLDGRFDMIALHVALTARRLGKGEVQCQDLAQEIVEKFVSDMDQNLRQIGVGDVSVPKKIKAMAAALKGRSEAYSAALTSQDHAALATAISRNIYRGEKQVSEHDNMTCYVLGFSSALERIDDSVFLANECSFPKPEYLMTLEPGKRQRKE